MSQQYFVTCACGQRIRIREEHFGKAGKCLKCQNTVTVSRDSAIPIDATPPVASATGETPAAEHGVPADWKPGDVILDLYEVKGVLGQGGMGKVYRVHHKGWNMDLAVKSPLPELLSNPGAVDNFVRECETWVNLGLHPNTVSCYYVRTLGGIPRVFAECVEGGTLEHWITSGKLYEGGKETALERILDIAIQFAWGLHYAHEQGLIHQDVKPANVMMTPDGIAKVTDFGLANARAVASKEAEGVRGPAPTAPSLMASYGGMTPAYCSPEQADNAARHQAGIPRDQWTKLSRQTDIYSWAVSVFEMFNGGVGWLAGNIVGESLKQYLDTGPPEAHLPPMPEGFATLLARCLQSDIASRYKDFVQIADGLITEYRNTTKEEYPREVPKPTEALADSLNNQGVSLLDLGRNEDAEKRFDRALQADSQHIEATYNRGLRRWRSGRMTDDALVRQLDELGKTHPGDWRVKYYLGQLHIERGDAESAVEVLAEALKGSGGSGEIERALETTRRGNGRWRTCLRTFDGHTHWLRSVGISPDGRWGLSGSEDCTLRLWELSTGRCLGAFEGHTRGVNAVSISPDGRWGLSGGADKTLRLWELPTGRCLRTLEGHTGEVKSVSISPDSHLGLSGSSDDTLRLWELSTGHCVRAFKGHTRTVTSVSFSPDGRWGLSGSFDNTVRHWDLSTGQSLRTFEGHTLNVTSVSISRDGRYGLSGSWDDTLRLWELSTGRCLRIFEGHTSHIESVSISPDGRCGLSGSANPDSTLRLWELSTGRCLRTFEGHTSFSVSISPDGRWGLSGSPDKTLRLWELQATGELAHFAVTRPRGAKEVGLQQRTREEAEQNAKSALGRGLTSEAAAEIERARRLPGYERDGTLLELWRQAGRKGRRKDFSDGWLAQTLDGHTEWISFVSISPDGQRGLSGSGDKTLRLWDLSTGRCLRVFAGHTRAIFSGSFSPDGLRGLSGSLDGTMRLWELSTGRCLRIFEGHTSAVNSVSVSPDGRWGLSGSEYGMGAKRIGKTIGAGKLQLWELATGRCLRTFEALIGSVRCVSISPNGHWGLSGCDHGIQPRTTGEKEKVVAGKLQLWELATGRCLRIFEGHTGTVKSVSFSPDGRWVLSGSEDKTLRLWELSTGQCLRIFEGHTSAVSSVSISPDGHWVLSGSNDKTLRLWELSTGRCLRIFEGHASGVSSVNISPDGRWGLSGSSDKTMRLWELVWDYEFPEPADWDEGARPYLEIFLTRCTPRAGELPIDRKPSDAEIQKALTPSGLARPELIKQNFNSLVHTLQHAGYGWLLSEGVRKELDKMAENWDGPLPLLSA